MGVASVLSATAATAAAILAGLNLIVSGRREDRRWMRETVTEAFVDYMHASFETGAACQKIVALRGSGRDDELLEEQRRIDEAHEAQMTNLTRLRLLSTAEVVTAAYELHELGHEVTDLLLGDGDAEAIKRARQRLRDARDQMVMASRKAMRVPDPGGTSLAGL